MPIDVEIPGRDKPIPFPDGTPESVIKDTVRDFLKQEGAFETGQAQADEGHFGTQILQGMADFAQSLTDDIFIGVGQNTSPIARDLQGNFTRPMADDQAQSFFNEIGTVQDAQTQVVLRDPYDKQLKVFIRTPETEEGAFAGLARAVSAGTIGSVRSATTPVAAATTARGVKRAAKRMKQGVRPLLRNEAAREARTAASVLEGSPIPGSTVSAVTSGTKTNLLEAGVRSSSAGQKRFAEADKLLNVGAKRRVAENAAKLGQAANTDRQMGETLAGAAQSYKTRFNELTTQLFDVRLAKKVPPGARVFSPPKTTNALDDLVEVTDELTGTFSTPKRIKDLQATLNKDVGLTWSELSELRSQVGELIDAGFELTGVSGGRAKKLYGALTADMKNMASHYEFLPLFERNNKIYEAGRKQINDVLSELVDVGGEKGMNWVKSLASTGAKADIAKLKRLKSSLRSGPAKNAVWGDLQATAVKGLGRRAAPDGREVFDLATYLRNYGAVSEEGKALLYGRSGALRKATDHLATTFARQVRLQERTSSPLARMAGQVVPGAQTTLGSGLPTSSSPGAIMGTIFGAIGAGGGAKLMTSPRFVNWVAKRTMGRPTGPLLARSPRGRQAVLSGVRELRRLIRVEEDPTNRVLMEEFLRQLERAPSDE